MALIDVNDFIRESECTYKGEHYSVRDNGAVFRHQRIGKRTRIDDNHWTFGKINLSNYYLQLSLARIHRIVATAFHGEPPNPEYVVDHIDTNRQNNRPENLRWVTRLENALLNPVTRKKIEYICGSIEAFLENPAMLTAYQDQKDLAWMRTVTLEEAQNCKERMSLWANSDKKPNGGSLGEWVYKPIKESETLNKKLRPETSSRKIEPLDPKNHAHLRTGINHKLSESSWNELVFGPIKKIETFDSEPELVMGLTKLCAQRLWGVSSYFPCCPEEIGNDPLESYFKNLKVGSVFAYNDKYPESTILEFAKSRDSSSILVMCEKDNLKPWSVAEITFENDFFVHTNLGSYFDKNGADKTFCIKRGLEWTGGDAFDDFC